MTGSAKPMRRILVVEDIAMIAEFIELILQRSDFQVSGIVDSGEDAINSVLVDPPDLVLMDIKLRGFVDGIEAAKIIRNNTDIPVLFVSAHTDPEMIRKAFAAGASGYVIKPFKGKELLASLEKVFDGGEIVPSACGPAGSCHPRSLRPV